MLSQLQSDLNNPADSRYSAGTCGLQRVDIAVDLPFTTEFGVIPSIGNESADIFQGIAKKDAGFVRETTVFCKTRCETV